METDDEDGVMETDEGNLMGSRPMMEKFLGNCDVELKYRVKRIGHHGAFIAVANLNFEKDRAPALCHVIILPSKQYSRYSI